MTPCEREQDLGIAHESDHLNPDSIETGDEKAEFGEFDINLKTGIPEPIPEGASQGEEKALAAAFFILGIGCLVPINSLLSVLDFYSLLFPEIPIAQYITNAYTLPFMITGTLFTTFPPPPRYRSLCIKFSFCMLILISLLIPGLATRNEPFKTRSSSLTSPQFYFIIFLTVLMGIVNALDQSVLYGVIGLFPSPSYTIGYTSGGAAAGIVFVCVRILTRFFFDPASHPTPSTLLPGFFVFFKVCAVFCFASVIVYFWMSGWSAEFARHIHEFWKRMTEDQRERVPLTDHVTLAKRTLVDIRIPAFCQVTCFTITLMFYPGIMSMVPIPLRENITVEWQSWYPLVVVATNTTGDTLGRYFLSGLIATRYPSVLLKLTLLRFLSIPVLAMLWVGLLPASWIAAFLLVFAHGYLNGFIMNMAFLVAGSSTSDERKEASGRLMFLMLNFGLFLGGACGWVVYSILTKTTSF